MAGSDSGRSSSPGSGEAYQEDAGNLGKAGIIK